MQQRYYDSELGVFLSVNPVRAATGYNLCWLLRVIANGRIKPAFLRLFSAWLTRRIGGWTGVIGPSLQIVPARG